MLHDPTAVICSYHPQVLLTPPLFFAHGVALFPLDE